MASGQSEHRERPGGAILEALIEQITAVPPYRSQWFWSHLGITIALLVWGWRLMKLDYRTGEIGSSIMHSILLPFHEAGHVFFRIFGEFMMVAGGSLLQVLVPLIVAGVFVWQQRDNVGASIGIWWCGVSLMDLAPYVYDANVPRLTLLNGATGDAGGHDWIYLLGRFHAIESSQRYGMLVHHIGACVMLVGIALALCVLFRSWIEKD